MTMKAKTLASKTTSDMIRIFFCSSVCLLLLYACDSKEQSGSKTVETKPEGKDSVAIYIAKSDSVEKKITLPSELLPYERVEIRSKIQGYLKKINVDIGSRVRKGQLLALIDAPEIASRLSEVTEKIQSAKAKYLASKDNFERIYAASQTDGVIAASELDKVKNLFMADSADYKAAIFTAATYKQMGNYLAITAPFNGVVTKRNAHEGTFVGNPGELPLLEIEDNSRLRLRVAVPEVYTGTSLKKQSIKFTTKAMPEKIFDAKLVRKSENIDNTTRSEIWEFEVLNPDKLLKAGMYADAKLVVLRSQPGITLPSSAIVTTLEKKFAIKIKQGKTEWIDINQGLNLGDKIEVFGDIMPGDTLVLKATEELKADVSVAIKPLKN
ncbi:efflux RND transporter periplasmic adaptor subunit [Dyadobacter psychrotolerans]|uniref:Efflux RND transporter periplasmic adaptor subunit n=2 Tax=Dyadobacter psychrotolerans TaxID=2541721 RepID=A0A4V2Z456_9BACT|nr:efflux RND transporter periplasmic adaptor subunit [Dyadobacter psychrotolerans]